MEKRDVLLYQIEQIGKIISQFVDGFKTKAPHSEEKILETNQKFKDEVSLDIDLLLKTDKSSLKDFFAQQNFTLGHAELICDYLIEIAKNATEKNATNLHLKKASEILEYISAESQSISFVRMQKEEEIKRLLK